MIDDHIGKSSDSEETTDVFIRVSFSKIYDIDTINQKYQADVIIEAKWFDKNLKDINDDSSKLIWKPDLHIENILQEQKEELRYKVINEDGKLMAYEIKKIRGFFYENLELENFPIDIQDLNCTVATKKSGKRVNFIFMQPEQCKIHISSNLDKSMWYLNDIVSSSKQAISREYAFGKREYPSVNIKCQVFRHGGYFYWNVLLPILLITIASLAPFIVDLKMPQSRLPSVATMLLSSVSYKVSISRLLPTVSYLTSIDKYSLASIVIITIIMLYHALIGGLCNYIDQELAYKLDKFIFFVFFTVIILKQLIYINWLIKVNDSRDSLINKSLNWNAEKNLNEEIKNKYD